MNRIFNLVWSHTLGAWVVASEHAARRRRSGRLRLLVGALALAPQFLPAADLPQEGRIVLGDGSIGSPAGSSLQIQQGSQKLAIDWQSFDIGAGHSVTFQQPDSGAIALNRVIGSDASALHGRLEANGRVFLINPNGILFGRDASVSVGGLVASTLELDNEDFAAGNYRFRSDGNPAGVSNLGRISASDGGAVALLGGQVGNDGIIQARMGTVALAAGQQITLDFAGDGLLSVQVDEAAAEALVHNGHLLKADGGSVLMTARASDALLQTVVNHDGIIEARTLASRDGRIVLQGGPDQGGVRVAGVLDASAPEGGDGGLIETSGATLKVADTAQVTTASSTGRAGTWRIGSSDLAIGAASASSISAATLSASLENGNVALTSLGSASQSGDITVNDALAWNAGTSLGLSARDAIRINADITASGTDAGLAFSDAGYRLRDGASITLSGGGARFSVNGEAYGVIQSLEALQGIGSDPGGRYVLGRNIDAGATGSWNDGAGFAPIGSSEQPFTGIFDGLGHNLSGLTINRTASDSVGLFGATQGATIRQLGLSEASIAGRSQVGSLVGQARASTIESTHASGSVSGYRQVGGLVGDSSGLITGSYHLGEVGGESLVGGLVGHNSGQVIGTFASGRVSGTGSGIGGLVGANTAGIVVANYSMGLVSGNTEVGGLTGINAAGLLAANYSTAAVSGSRNVGGLVGLGAGGLVLTGGFGAAFPDGIGAPSGLDGSTLLAAGYSIGNLAEIATGAGLPWLAEGLAFGDRYGLEGIASISTFGDLQTLIGSRLAAAGYSLETFGASGLPAQLFELGGSALAEQLGSVSGLANVGGLMGLNADGIVAGSHSFADVHGYANVGGLVGASSGLLIGNSASGTVLGKAENTGGLVGLNAGTLRVSYATGNVGGVSRVGGLAGYNIGSIDTSYAAGNVAIGAQSGSAAGGLVGSNAGSITSSFASGSVTNAASGTGGLVGANASSGLIADTYASGSVTGGSEVGGLVGANAGSVANSYAAGPVAGSGGNLGALLGYNGGNVASSYWNATAAGGLPGIGGGNASGAGGLSMEQMTRTDSFAGWSLSATQGSTLWRIYEGQTAPLLRAFMTPLTVTTEDAGKTYDGTVWSGGSGYTLGSIRPNFWHRSLRVDDSLIQGSVNTREPARNAGRYALDSGLHSSQLGYDLGYDAGTLTIHKASLILSASPDSKGYDGTVASSGTVGVSGLAAGDSVVATQAFDSAEVGERVLQVERVTIADGNGGNNYEVSLRSAAGAITAAPPRSNRPDAAANAADDRTLRTSAAYLAELAANDPCKSAGQQLSSAESSDCPAASTLVERPEGSELSYRIENGGMRLPEGL